MSTLHLERPVIERSRPGPSQERRLASPARERTWECVPLRFPLAAAELADAMVRPHSKIYRDFSDELARVERWRGTLFDRKLLERSL